MKAAFMRMQASGSNFLTKSISGDGSDDYLEVRDSLNARIVQNLVDWTFEIWFQPPTNLTANEAVFSTLNANGNPNLMRLSFVDRTSTDNGYWLDVVINDSVGTLLITRTFPILLKTPQSIRPLFHLAVTCKDNGGTYTFNFYLNGLKIGGNLSNPTFGARPTQFGFNYLTDRLVAARYSDAKIVGTRFYNRELSATELYQSYNSGKGAPVIGANCLFDFPLGSLAGSDFTSTVGTNKLTGVNYVPNVAGFYGSIPAEPPQKRIIFEGNSLVFGTGSTGILTQLPIQVLKKLNDPVVYETIYNLGVGSQTTDQIIANFNTKTLLHFNNKRTQNIYVLSEGINSLRFGKTAAQTIADLTTACQLAKNAGFKVVLCTLTPRSDAGTPGTYENDRSNPVTGVNPYLQANYRAMGADRLADVTLDPAIGAAGAETNPTNFTDLVHMTDVGYGRFADIIYPEIQAIV